MNYFLSIVIENQFQIDIFDPRELPVTMSRGVEEESDVNKRRPSRVLEYSVPATDNNNSIFNYYFDHAIIHNGQNEWRSVTIFYGTLPLFKGKLIMESVSQNRNNIGYRLNMIGEMADWVTDLGQKGLCNFVGTMNVPGGVHNYTEAAIQASWAGSYDLGWDYVYTPVIYDFVSAPGRFLWTDFRPSIYYRALIRNAFNSIGYTVKSTFLDSDFFKRKIAPFVWGRFGHPENWYLANTDVKVSNDADQDISDTGGAGPAIFGVVLPDETSVGNFDNGGSWSGIAYTAPISGLYNINFDVTIEVLTTGSAIDDALFFRLKVNGGASLVPLLTDPTSVPPYIDITTPIYTGSAQIQIFLNAADFFGIEVQVNNLVNIKITSAVLAVKKKRTYELGDIVNWGDVMPCDYTFIDLMVGLKELFNLYFETDSILKIVTIETRDDVTEETGEIFEPFFKIDASIDYTEKIELNHANHISTTENYRSQKRILSRLYADDSNDYHTELIRKERGNVLYRGRWNFSHRFLEGEDLLKNSFFAATVHARSSAVPGSTPLIPVIRKNNDADSSIDFDGYDTKFKPRILHYAGLRPGSIIIDNVIFGSYPKAFVINYDDNTGTDPSLSFSTETVGTTSTSETTGLLAKYYLKQLAQLQDGRMLNPLWMLMSDNDLLSFSFRIMWKLKMPREISANLWYPLELMSYTPLKPDANKWRLIRHKYPTPEDCDRLEDTEMQGIVVVENNTSVVNSTTSDPPLSGFVLTWDDVANSPFTSAADLNAFINARAGSANYTGMTIVGNSQVFTGGSNVNLGNYFASLANTTPNVYEIAFGNNLIAIDDPGCSVVQQGHHCQYFIGSSPNPLQSISLPCLTQQADYCQSCGNQMTASNLISINLPAMTAQLSNCQQFLDVIPSISFPALLNQGGTCQNNLPLCVSINLPSLVGQMQANQVNAPLLATLNLPALQSQTDNNQRALGISAISLPALLGQGNNNQSVANYVTINMPVLQTQGTGNQTGAITLTSIYMPNLTFLGGPGANGNFVASATSALTITVDTVLATNNAGSPDGDLQYAISQGATIIYM